MSQSMHREPGGGDQPVPDDPAFPSNPPPDDPPQDPTRPRIDPDVIRSRAAAAESARARHDRPGLSAARDAQDFIQGGYMRSILLWLLGVPIPIIILLALFWH
ncbi:hypothetical protein [Achromobacter xylosoxidans]|uniref:hypothetical protein n=1 Tax=Alcaligenes xylosoxydans xylosoxydans TaxID=85698 RepID=UPI00211AFC7E|nr:hypothetical protein [Achromobacter xylosoxidans]